MTLTPAVIAGADDDPLAPEPANLTGALIGYVRPRPAPGTPPAMTGEQIRQARDLLTRPGNSISSIARLLGVSRSTIYKHLPELADGHRPAGQIPPHRPGLSPRLAITAPSAARSHVGSDDNAASGRERCDAG